MADEGDSEAAQRAFYERDIVRLKTEIKRLERRVGEAHDEQLATQDNMEEIMEHLLRASDAEFNSGQHLTELDGPSDKVSAQMQTLASLTGITILDVSSTTLPVVPAVVGPLRHYSLSGRCEDLSFSLALEVSEDKQTIQFLRVQVDTIAEPQLADFLQHCQDARSPHLFFRGFVQFAQWCSRRRRLFESLHGAFPASVRLPQGCFSANVIDVAHPDISGLGFALQWDLQISTAGRVSSVIDVKPRVSAEVLALDGAAVCQTLNEEFAALRHVRGIEDAARALIEATTGETPQ